MTSFVLPVIWMRASITSSITAFISHHGCEAEGSNTES